MKAALPNLLGAAIRDYFSDHLPRLRGTHLPGRQVRTSRLLIG
ncbi:MAG TPA: hypothetical protein VHZ07_21660 [Bryobacteraceae bacterium]|jgi:Arc/MetJ family transcription regulator|nr:hypothetical protein [Bryobacteraceae bacterium]